MSKKHKNRTQPQILKDLNTLFSPAVSGLTYDQYKQFFDLNTEKIPEKYSRSIYVRTTAMAGDAKLHDDNIVSSLVRLNLFYYWSLSKEIYQFDCDFAEELRKTPIETIPYQTLKHLPYDTFAISIGKDYLLIHKGYDKNHVESEYLIIAFMNHENEYINCMGIPLHEDFSHIAQLRAICRDERQCNDVISWLNLVMYLTSEKSDIEPNIEQKTITKRSKQVRNTYREIRKWDVGYRFGTAFRKQKESNRNSVNHDSVNGASKRPHIRRAHWHHFWTGERNSPDRKLVIKWLSPIAINAQNDTDLPAVIHDV